MEHEVACEKARKVLLKALKAEGIHWIKPHGYKSFHGDIYEARREIFERIVVMVEKGKILTFSEVERFLGVSLD